MKTLIFVASDHGGFRLKKRLIRYLKNELKIPARDMGPKRYTEDDDYPDYAIPLAKKVAKTKNGRGVLLCKNGVGVCIAANKIPGIRAGIGYNLMAAETMRTDDDTNILCLPAKALSEDHAMAIVKRWLGTGFSQEKRHERRLKKIQRLES